jgi:hypothetical protein
VKQAVSLFCALAIVAGAWAQPPPPPTIGPNEPQGGSVWKILTPEQRDQVWRMLTPEQRSDLWRGLAPDERREMRERVAPPKDAASAMPWQSRPRFDAGDGASRAMMTPEERQRMREQIREAHRLRRERQEAERARPAR